MAEEKEVKKTGDAKKSKASKSESKPAAGKKKTAKKPSAKTGKPKSTAGKPAKTTKKKTPKKKTAKADGKTAKTAKTGKTGKSGGKTAGKKKEKPVDPKDIVKSEGELAGMDGLKLKTYAWEPPDSKAVFLLVHGFGEHAGRYGFFYDYFLPRGFAVYTMDNRGHGESAGRRGHVSSYDDYVEDLRFRAIETFRAAGERKVFLVGHSNGGLIALRYALKYPDGLAGVIVSGPLLKLAIEAPRWKTALGIVTSVIAPTLTMANEIVPERLSRDEEVQKAYLADPLVHHVVSSRWFTEMNKACADALDRASTMTVPSLMLHGEADELCSIYGTRMFHHSLRSGDAEIRSYEGYRHEIFNEIGKEKVFADIENWVEPRV